MRNGRLAWTGAAGAFLAAVAITAAAGSAAANPSARAAPPACNQTGKGTGDWEAAFGRRKIRRKANELLAKVHRKGFLRAVIEREQCTYEVAVIHLSYDRAYNVAARARRKGFTVRVVES
jgi:hypothetical protein